MMNIPYSTFEVLVFGNVGVFFFGRFGIIFCISFSDFVIEEFM